MSYRNPVPSLALVIALAGTALAHGTSPHLMGTAESVSTERLVVKDPKGASHEVVVGPRTRYRTESGGAAKAGDLKPGDRVVVHFGGHGTEAPAAEVRFKSQ
jgi:hypothetical protein